MMTLADRPQIREQLPAEDPPVALPARKAPRAIRNIEPLAPTDGEARKKGGHRGDLGQKRELELADLLMMDTLDQKAPPPPALAEGTADLLQSLVEDHLRAQPTRDIASPTPDSTPEDTLIPAPVAEIAPPAASARESAFDDSALLLQREIETLLRGNTGGEAVPPSSAETHTPDAVIHVPPPESPLHEEPDTDMTAPVAPSEAAVTPAELDTLVPAADPGLDPFAPDAVVHPIRAAGPVQIPKMPSHATEEEETARQLSEAEGVLAAELAQLMAETTAATPAAASPAIIESPAAPAIRELPPLPAVLDEPPSITPSRIAATMTKEARIDPATLPPPVVVELPETEGTLEEAEPRKPSFVERVRSFVSGMVLLVAQLIDMPFSWISELDKNVLGLVAFLLLASGFAMYFVSLYYR
jgi:hypothetical protein